MLRLSYRISLVFGVLVMLNAVIAPSVMAATLPGTLAASKSRAEADARVLAGPDASAALTGGVPQQSQSSVIPHPVRSFAVPMGAISDSQAKDIAGTSLNGALDGGPQLVQTGDTFRPKVPQSVSSRTSGADAEANLRQELAFQGYPKTQIDAAVAALKDIKASIDRQAANNTVSIPAHANGAVGFGANVTLSL